MVDAGETKIRRHVKIRKNANPFDPQCHAPLVLSFPNGFKAQSERQTNKNNYDSRPQTSILFSALSSLKDEVRPAVIPALGVWLGAWLFTAPLL
jgi:hypothetical protein